MSYWHLLYDLPAALSATLIACYLSPWRVAPRAVPVVMFAAALAVLSLPQVIGVALCLTLLGGYVADRLGMTFSGHDPVKVTLPRLPRLARQKVREFATTAFPAPPGDDAPQREPGGQATAVPSYVPAI